MSPDQPTVSLSVDLEDWPQSTFDRSLPISSRCVDNTHALLDLLDRGGGKATFFVLGKVAERFPDLIAEVAQRGHEVASHGYGHVEIFDQSRDEFRRDVERSCVLLEGITGTRPIGYRAPDFSIVMDSMWALEMLPDFGFTYDSSIYPIRHARYGIDSWPLEPVQVELPAGNTILECPPAVATLRGNRVPVAGGGYQRLLPYPVTKRALRAILGADRPVVTYYHPYELDTAGFRALTFKVPLKTRLHQGLGRSRFRARFARLLQDFRGVPVSELLGSPWPARPLAEVARSGVR